MKGKRAGALGIFLLLAYAISYGGTDCSKRPCHQRLHERLGSVFVLIDPGHGGSDPGAVNPYLGLRESELNWAMANLIEARLVQKGIINVSLTRKTESETLNYIARPKKINDILAGWKSKFKSECEEFHPYLISIHHNSSDNSSAHGTEEYYGYSGENWLPWCIHNNLLSYFVKHGDGIIDGTSSPNKKYICGRIFEIKDKGILINGEKVKISMQHSLVEVCFISNEQDFFTWRDNYESIANSIADAIIWNATFTLGMADSDCWIHYINDSPDDNYSSASKLLYIARNTRIDNDSEVGVLVNNIPLDTIRMLNDLACKPALIDAELTPDVAQRHPVLVIPFGGLFGLENSEQFKSSLRSYVEGGGTVLVFSQQHGYEYGVLPRRDGKTVGAYGWREDQSCLTKSIYLDTWHPGLSSVTTPDVSVPVDGYIYDYPEDATVLLRRTRNAEPALVTWQVGAGRVIASSLFTDYQGGISDQRIVRDLITWAKNPNLPIPEYNLRNNASPEVSLNLELKNITETAASKAKLFWLDADRNVMFEEERLVSIPAGENLALSISHTFSAIPNGKLGIWHVDYELYDAQGEVIQPQAEADSGRFIVSRPPTELFEVSDLIANVTTTGEEFLMGSKATFQVHFANRAEQDKKLHLWWDLLHGEGHYWKEVVVPAQGTLIEEISVDLLDCEGDVRFWLHIFEENGQGVYHSLIDMFRHVTNEPWRYVGSASRGIKVLRPSYRISVQSDKEYYKRGEEVKFSLPFENNVPFDYPVDYTFVIRGRDVNGQEKTFFSDQGTVEMPANGEKTLEKTLFLGEDAGFGQYKAFLTIYYDNSPGNLEDYFHLSSSYVNIEPQIPSLFVYGQESNLSFNLTCGTIFPAENGNLSLRLVSAQKEELFRETKPARWSRCRGGEFLIL